MRVQRPGRRAAWVAIRAAYGGGGIGALGALGYGLIRAEARLARRTIGEPSETPPDPTGIYGRMPKSHIPFDYAYQYLAGGVNTGQGWATWNADGAFASLYVHDSWAHGQVPVLTYYMLLQSKPGGGDEAHANLTNLRNAETMSAYWNDVKLLVRTAPVVLSRTGH